VTLNSPASSCVQTSEVSHAAGTDVAPVRAYPNPFRDDVSVEFGVPTGALVRMEVFDVQGRRVFATGAVYFPSGRHVLKWDGRNDHGNAPPKGTYRVRISGRGFEATRSVILLNR
jgi:hypothetical protein